MSSKRDQNKSGDAVGLLWPLAVTALIFSAVTVQLSYTVADPDLWGHLKFGQDFWEAGGVVQSDPYAYTSARQRWINHEWLSEAIFAGLFDVFGSAGLVGLKIMLWLVTIGALYRYLLSRGANHVLAGVLVLFSTLFVFGTGTYAVRPHLFSFPLFLATLLLLQKADQGNPRWLWIAPPLFALWVNLHGGVLAGLGIFGAWTVAHVIIDREIRWQLVLPFTASLVALLLNPYWFDLPKFLLVTGTVPRPEITEWKPVDLSSLLGFGYLTLLAVGIVGILLSRRPRSPALVFLFVVVAATPLLAVRLLPMFGIGVLVLAGEHIADVWKGLGLADGGREPAFNRNRRKWMSGLALLIAPLLLISALQGASCITLERNDPYPVGAVAFLRANGVEANLAVPFNWGEYVIWHLSPGVQVSMDGRRETVYSDSTYHSSRDFEQGRNDWDAILAEEPTDLALVKQLSPPANLLELHPGWDLVYEDGIAVVYARSGSSLSNRLANAAVPDIPHDGAGMCFQ